MAFSTWTGDSQVSEFFQGFCYKEKSRFFKNDFKEPGVYGEKMYRYVRIYKLVQDSASLNECEIRMFKLPKI